MAIEEQRKEWVEKAAAYDAKPVNTYRDIWTALVEEMFPGSTDDNFTWGRRRVVVEEFLKRVKVGDETYGETIARVNGEREE